MDVQNKVSPFSGISSPGEIRLLEELPAGYEEVVSNEEKAEIANALEQRSYKVVEKVGEGAYGEVYKALNHLSEAVALKIIKKIEFNWSLKAEKCILDLLQKGTGSGKEKIAFAEKLLSYQGHMILQLPLADRSLAWYTRRPSSFLPLGKMKAITRQLIGALAYLEGNHIVHADIKPGNILLFTDSDIKITDFGTAFLRGWKLSKDFFGTTIYQPPEIILSTEDYGHEADIWSTACVIVELVIRKYTFATQKILKSEVASNKELFEEVSNAHQERIGEYPQSLKERAKGQGTRLTEPHASEKKKSKKRKQGFDEIPDAVFMRGLIPSYKERYPNQQDGLAELQKLLGRMFTLDPQDRPRAKELLKDPFLKESKCVNEK